MRSTYTLLSLAFVMFANAQQYTNGSIICGVNTCWENGPDNATDHGCTVWAGGVDAWAECGYVGAVSFGLSGIFFASLVLVQLDCELKKF